MEELEKLLDEELRRDPRLLNEWERRTKQEERAEAERRAFLESPRARVKANGHEAVPQLKEENIVPALEDFIRNYLVMPDSAVLPLACWVAATYFYRCFDAFPYLSIVSPAKRCGKTRLAEVLGCVALNPVLTTGISEAALFRLVDRGGCTLLLDEAEALRSRDSERSQAIVSILNAGYRQGASVYRCVPPKHDLQPFNVYGPKAVIAIGTLPDTVADRSIVVRMRRRRRDEPIGRFLSRRARMESEPIRRALEAIQKTLAGVIASVYETLPDIVELSDRDAEIWTPLFALCSVLAPARLSELQQAAVALSGAKAEADADDSLLLKLLADIALVLPDFEHNVPSAELLARLKGLEESPWGEPGRELTQNRLARMLKQFGPQSRKVRLGPKSLQGYLKIELEEAVALYIQNESGTSGTEQ